MKQFLLSFLLTSLSTSILVLLLSLLFTAFKTKISVRVKYFIWFLILLSFLFPFRPQFGSGLIRLNTGSVVQTAVTATQTGGAQGASPAVEKVAQPNLWEAFLGLPWFEILFAIWLIGFVFSIGRYAYSYIRFRKMLKRWGTEFQDEEAMAQLQAVQQEMGVKGRIHLLHYPMSQSPMLLGFRDILIVLPELDYTEEELQLIFKHELTHYKHRDVLINLLGIFAKSLHWFNPVVRFACRETQEAGEMYCDYDVLSCRDAEYRTFYGETILTMIDRSKKTPIALTTCFYSDKFNLKRRIVGIMDNRLPKRFLSAAFVVAVPLLLLLTSSVFALESPAAQQSRPVAGQKQSQGLSQRQALASVLKELSLSEKDIKDLQISREKDTYKIRFSHGQTAHETIINAKDGKLIQSKQHTIVEKTVTVEKEVSPSSSAASSPADNSATAGAGNTGAAGSTGVNTGASTATVQTPSQNSSSHTTDTDDPDDDDDHDDD